MKVVVLPLGLIAGAVFFAAPALGYQSGALRNHSHTTAAGQGGALGTNTVDTGKIKADSITTAKILSGAVTNAKTVGTSATCGATQYLSAATYTNGLPSGGSCVTAGDAVLGNNQTFTGNDTFSAPATFTGGNSTSGGSIKLGNATTQTANLTVSAKSIDGANEGGNCIGVIASNGLNGALVWTSTTTSGAAGLLGVTAASCNAGAQCDILVLGHFVAQNTGASTLGNCIQTSGTRCQTTQSGAPALTCSGVYLQTTGGAGYVDVFLAP